MYELWYLNDAVLEYRFFQCEYKQNLYCYCIIDITRLIITYSDTLLQTITRNFTYVLEIFTKFSYCDKLSNTHTKLYKKNAQL